MKEQNVEKGSRNEDNGDRRVGMLSRSVSQRFRFARCYERREVTRCFDVTVGIEWGASANASPSLATIDRPNANRSVLSRV